MHLDRNTDRDPRSPVVRHVNRGVERVVLDAQFRHQHFSIRHRKPAAPVRPQVLSLRRADHRPHGCLGEFDHHRARSIGEAIVKAAEETGADLIVLGSSPRWRRQSRFFSPTVDYVLRKAPAEVLVVAFPQGVLEEA